MKRLSATVQAEGWEDIWGWGCGFGGRGDYSPLLTFSALPAPLMADRTHKGTCPIPECPPRLPLLSSPDLTGIPGLQGVLPMATFTQPPRLKPKSGNPTANTVAPAQKRRTRLLAAARRRWTTEAARHRGNRAGKKITEMGRSNGVAADLKVHKADQS